MRLHIHAALTALLTFLLMSLGSLVHGTGSSLACPDWPLCHGDVFPAMRGGVEYEHSHRLLALAVIVATVALAIRARRADGRTRALGWTAVLLLALQASLGAATVILRLPTLVSVAHLATSMVSLAVLVAIAARAWPARGAAPVVSASTHRWLRAAFAAALAQVVLGAIVRHSGAALACTDLPWCASAWPCSRLEQLHAVHRAGALLTATLVVVACTRLARRAPSLGRVAFVPIAVVAAQIALGAAVVAEHASLPVVTAHHATGALLVASLAVLLARARRAPMPERPYAVGHPAAERGALAQRYR